ncbi:MAG: protein-L-isoaspartate(D-aspartate) O-methyltransferase [Thermomicrobiales bacterium]|jgi:protein-L-isoaspartate(D-aspartate) O-methyltransferase|nr:protein-L-isoaspartate(D-aspartate) O-methyltransferase [Thermomicrobiales bacterium]
MPRHHSQQIEHLIRTLRHQGITDERVLEAIRTVPRHAFVPEDLRDQAWDNNALPLAQGQTISQPFIVALMSQALALTGQERVLEIGTGSGYQAAVLSKLARDVVTIERIPELSRTASELLDRLGFDNITVFEGDGSTGIGEAGDWDAIMVTAGAPEIPQALLSQLRENEGRMVVPVGPPGDQRLILLERHGRRHTQTDLGPVAFVPLVGSAGWPDSAD